MRTYAGYVVVGGHAYKRGQSRSLGGGGVMECSLELPGSVKARLRLHHGSIRLCEGTTKALLRLYEGSVKALLRLYYGSIKALLRLYRGSVTAVLRLC